MYGQPGWSMNALPNGKMLRGRKMRNSGDDPAYSIKKALPPIKEQQAGFKGGLSRLGARSVS
jgi:hypothetical protein